ncbi:Sensor histidine kinase ComP [compost metagenome]
MLLDVWEYLPYSLTRLLTLGSFVCGIFLNISKLIQGYIWFRKTEISSLFKIMLLGQIASFTPFILLTLLPQLLGGAILSFDITTVFLVILPVTYVYLLTAKQLLDIDFIVSRFKYYLSIALLPAGIIVAAVGFIQQSDDYPWVKWVQMFLVVYLFIIIFLFFKETLDRSFRNMLDPKMLDYQNSLERFSKRITKIMKRPDLENVLQKEISELLPVNKVEFLHIPEKPHTEGTLHEAAHLLYSLPNLPAAGEAVQLDKGVVLNLGSNRGELYILWINHKKNHTRFNRDEMNWLNTISNYSSIVCENLYFIEGIMENLESRIKRQSGSSSWVSRLIFNLAEKERRKLAADLHDSALQDQLVWMRRLESVLLEYAHLPEVKRELLAIKEGLLDVIYQIRETCNELRPPFLREAGIVQTLENLFEYAQLQSNYTIKFTTEPIGELGDELVITLYRITQELLRNATKHSEASHIRISLQQGELIYFTYEDNGVGMDIMNMQESFLHMGLSGIKERVASLGGTCQFYSEKGTGFQVSIALPLKAYTDIQEEKDDSYFAC